MNDFAGGSRELANVARQRCGELLRSRLAMALTFCSIVETELRWGASSEISEALDKARHTAAEVRIRLDQAPDQARPDLENQLAALEQRIRQIEVALRRRHQASGQARLRR